MLATSPARILFALVVAAVAIPANLGAPAPMNAFPPAAAAQLVGDPCPNSSRMLGADDTDRHVLNKSCFSEGFLDGSGTDFVGTYSGDWKVVREAPAVGLRKKILKQGGQKYKCVRISPNHNFCREGAQGGDSIVVVHYCC